jgi:hypothetical protein
MITQIMKIRLHRLQKQITKIGLPLMGMLVLSLFCFGYTVQAQTPEETEETVEFKEITGEVVLLNAGMISVEYHRSAGVSREILIPLDEETKLKHLRGLNYLNEGDTVTVSYKETYIVDENGKRTNFRRVATQIVLVRRTTEALRSTE